MRIGFIGLGHIGGAIATNLAQDGVELPVEGIERRSSEPQFALELAAKDADLFVALGHEVGSEGRMAGLAAAILHEACERGMARSDWTNLPAFFESEGDFRFRLAKEQTGD
ncbi:MAG: NAD(P)-binding domain-containing protein [Deltaproteobacteria bacterium]|nr:NAD(P)-binding domain-containing protein [Deltaproteobacteria bacterium]MBW2382389.1 NAD(P)-binding domain-containing protein [Deltaproteobacteria bacterium]MBW2696617.1 NAD(P)-binding domain-containing protein [Deltaproteobacteria bacterium]